MPAARNKIIIEFDLDFDYDLDYVRMAKRI